MTATRDSIAAAASRLFADQGYSATSVRTIAAAAGVDPALVIRHFGSKESLFLETTSLGGTMAAVVHGPLSGIGEAIARYVVVEAGTPVRQAFVALQQASAHPQVRAQLAAAIEEVFVTPLAPRLAGPDADVRSRLVASLVGGLMTALWSTGDEGLLRADPETVVGYYGALIQRLVDHPAT
jgi:AcrR family transcriptional regulator